MNDPGRAVTLEGIGLRSGTPCRVTLRARPGPFSFCVEGLDVALVDVRVVVTERTTTVSAGPKTVATVEHLLAACAALGLHEGLSAMVGDELPLLDGASSAFLRALGELDLPCAMPPLRVTREAVLSSGSSRYSFRPAGVAASSVVSVKLELDDARIDLDAAWDGTREDFERIGSARTFAFAHEVPDLIRAGSATHVDPKSVVVLTPDEILSQGAPFTSDEPARHKLLDLMGDLFLYGGPPRGEVHAERPGHRATHDIVQRALEMGVLVQRWPA
jgi:UDP-3-O-acyl-N-acetylglucosamine deacetylase